MAIQFWTTYVVYTTAPTLRDGTFNKIDITESDNLGYFTFSGIQNIESLFINFLHVFSIWVIIIGINITYMTIKNKNITSTLIKIYLSENLFL